MDVRFLPEAKSGAINSELPVMAHCVIGRAPPNFRSRRSSRRSEASRAMAQDGANPKTWEHPPSRALSEDKHETEPC